MNGNDKLLSLFLICAALVLITITICVTAYNWHIAGLPCHAAHQC